MYFITNPLTANVGYIGHENVFTCSAAAVARRTGKIVENIMICLKEETIYYKMVY